MIRGICTAFAFLLALGVAPASEAKDREFRHFRYGGPIHARFVDDDDWDDYWEDREEYFEDLQEEREEYYEELRERREDQLEKLEDFYKDRDKWSRRSGYFSAPIMDRGYVHPRSRVHFRFYYAPPLPPPHNYYRPYPRFEW